MRTLDDLVGDEAPALVKIDVEGAEGDLLAGGTRLLARPDAPVLVFEVISSWQDTAARPADLGSFLRSRGYELCRYEAEHVSLHPFDARDETFAGNVIAVKDTAPVLARPSVGRADRDAAMRSPGFRIVADEDASLAPSRS
jgi:hypothetical protein